MTRWYVGVKPDGEREVFGEFSGHDPIASARGYVEVCGPYKSEREAAQAAKGKRSIHGGSLRKDRKDRV
jgi:hypothetical protein